MSRKSKIVESKMIVENGIHLSVYVEYEEGYYWGNYSGSCGHTGEGRQEDTIEDAMRDAELRASEHAMRCNPQKEKNKDDSEHGN